MRKKETFVVLSFGLWGLSITIALSWLICPLSPTYNTDHDFLWMPFQSFSPWGSFLLRAMLKNLACYPQVDGGSWCLYTYHSPSFILFHSYFKYWWCLETLTISTAESLSQVWSGIGDPDFSINIYEKNHTKHHLCRFLLHFQGPSQSIVFLFQVQELSSIGWQWFDILRFWLKGFKDKLSHKKLRLLD